MKQPSKSEVEAGRCGPESEVQRTDPLNAFERIKDASTETREKLAAAVQAEQDADIEATNKNIIAKSRQEEHARLKAKADELREKAEAEAFGARFHREILKAMQSGFSADVLAACAMKACADEAGIRDLLGINTVVRGEPHEFRSEMQCHPRGYVPTMTEAQVGETLRDAVPPKVQAFRNLAWDKGPTFIPKLCDCAMSNLPHMHLDPPEKPEPAPPAYSVAERQARAMVAQELGAILGGGRWAPGPGWTLKDALDEVARRCQPCPVASAIRDAALEEAALIAVDHAELHVAWKIRALKSKPTPQPSENPGELPKAEPVHDFAWAIEQMRMGKKVRRKASITPAGMDSQAIDMGWVQLGRGRLSWESMSATDWEVVG